LSFVQDVRLYEGGVVTDVDYKNNGITLTLSFDVKKLARVNWNITKRLLFGSLLCLTADGFRSVMFASVGDRKPEDLAKGIVKIRPETHRTDINAWASKTFLIIESSSFFEAYRHFLSSLQKMPLERYPLKKYIVEVERWTSFPDYLASRRGTDAQRIPLSHMIVKRGALPYADPFNDEWPEPEEMGLDEAQFRAFKAGITREFALIQGKHRFAWV
jgi:hypothetical protein